MGRERSSARSVSTSAPTGRGRWRSPSSPSCSPLSPAASRALSTNGRRPYIPGHREGPVAGILLAAGTSSRMGSNKMLFELEGESVLRRAARQALAAGLSPLVVVLGHEADKAKREIEGLPCQWTLNPLYEQ